MTNAQITPEAAAWPIKDTTVEQTSSDGYSSIHDSNLHQSSAIVQSSISKLTFTFLVDKTPYKGRPKPNNEEMGAIRNRLSLADARVTANIEELEGFISSGYTIMPAICNGGTKKENWVAQQLFFLDFDNDEAMRSRGYSLLDPEKAMDRAFERRLSPLLLYFSHSASIDPYLPKYRMVFSLENASEDRIYIRAVGNALLEVFPEADPASIRPTQMFLAPGKEVWSCWKML